MKTVLGLVILCVAISACGSEPMPGCGARRRHAPRHHAPRHHVVIAPRHHVIAPRHHVAIAPRPFSVCGSDGRTYVNIHALHVQQRSTRGLHLRHFGACGIPAQPAPRPAPQPAPRPVPQALPVRPVACICTREFRQVCGSDGKTYSNKCLLDCETRKNPSVVLRNNGPCVSPKSAPGARPPPRIAVCPPRTPSVCGTDGKTYASLQALRQQQRTTRGLNVRHYGACRNGTQPAPPSAQALPARPVVCACPAIWGPVCGSDGKTYSNKCLLDCETRKNPSVVLRSTGACKGKGAFPPPRISKCPPISLAVCGSDGKTYPSFQALQQQKKITKGLSVKHRGPCGGSTTRKPRTQTVPEISNCGPPPTFSPLCGSDGKTYANLKALQQQQKTTKGLSLKHYGPCTSSTTPKPLGKSQPIRNANSPCPRVYRPVCGSDGVTYPSRCALNRRAKRRRGLRMSYRGPCESDESDESCVPCTSSEYDEACSCPDTFAPVCGSDGSTYPNQCQLECQQWEDPYLTLVSQGYCGQAPRQPVEPKKSRFCPTNRSHKPVCGSDGKTYDNSSVLRCAQMDNPGLTEVHRGACKTPAKPKPTSPPQPKRKRICSTNRSGKPVCGSDGKTYTNSSFLHCAQRDNPGLTEVHKGGCKTPAKPKPTSPPQPKKRRICSIAKIKKPVCGSDGKTYSNSGALRCAKRDNPGLTEVHSGGCNPPTTPKPTSPPQPEWE